MLRHEVVARAFIVERCLGHPARRVSEGWVFQQVLAIAFGNDGGIVVQLPVDDGRYGNRLSRFALDELVRQAMVDGQGACEPLSL